MMKYFGIYHLLTYLLLRFVIEKNLDFFDPLNMLKPKKWNQAFI